MKNTYDISGYTVATTKDEFTDNVFEMQSEVSEAAQTENYINKLQEEAGKAVEVMSPKLADIKIESGMEDVGKVVKEKDAYTTTPAPLNINESTTNRSGLSGTGLCVFLGFLIVAIIVAVKILKKPGRRTVTSKNYVGDEQARYADEIRRMEENNRMQEEIFRQQMQQTQDEEQRRLFEQQMLEFQRQMQRDMETAQRNHEEFMRQAEYHQQVAQQQFDYQQQSNQDYMNHQMQQDFMNQSFDNFNNGF